MRLGVDSGGTFTDAVALGPDGRLHVYKLPSDARDPAAPLGGALEVLAARPGIGPLVELVHATTVATNALLERRGGPTLLVTTGGFEDVLELGRQTRPRLYALHPVKPAPLVDAALRLGVAERRAHDGSVVRPLEDAELEALVRRVRELGGRAGVRSIAVCLLHSYADDAHERRVAAALAPLGLPISLSCEVLPLPREYERTSTTVVDAYVAPAVAPYLERVEAIAQAAGAAAMTASDAAAASAAPAKVASGTIASGDNKGSVRVRVMQSNGGVLAASEAARRPVRTLLSGPAAGVTGALAIARAAGLDDVITLDMGGTSTDVALIAAGRVALTDEAEVAGCALQLPMLALHTVGAGGGSIAWQDAGGALKVGPRSAGAQPGPAAYGRGGNVPTVTDANLVLGRLPPALLDGAMALDGARAHAVITELAGALGVAPERAAEDVVAVANAVMARAIKVVSVERGHDPARATLLPFGGAGALHACAIARELGMRRVLVPPAPGLLCAWGALAADVVRDFVATRLRTAPALPAESLAADFAPLVAAATQALDADGVAAAARHFGRSATLRYHGQSFELEVPVADGGDLVAAFHEAHRGRYGYALERPVELVTLRLRATGVTPPVPPPTEPLEDGAPLTGRARAWLDGAWREAPHYRRRRLCPGFTFTGPAVIAEYSATTWVPPDVAVAVRPDGALLLSW